MAMFVRRTPPAQAFVATRALLSVTGSGQPDVAPPVAAASEDTKKNSSPDGWAGAAATTTFLVGLVVAVLLFGTPASGPTYTPVVGIGAFALFYVAAQSAERLVEMILPAIGALVPALDKPVKEAVRDQKVAAAHGLTATPADGDQTPEQAAANAQADVDQARANRAAVTFGLTAAVGMALCGYFEADFLTALGVTFGESPGLADEILMMAVTGLVVGGGAKGLHETITLISKSSEKKSTPPETGGET